MSYLKQVYPASVRRLRDESFWSAEELLCVGVNPVSCAAGDKNKEVRNNAAGRHMKVTGNIAQWILGHILKMEIKYSGMRCIRNIYKDSGLK